MPLEYFLIELFQFHTLFFNLFLFFFVILAIEIFKFEYQVGVFDIDDIILAILGMMVFYVVYHKVKNVN